MCTKPQCLCVCYYLKHKSFLRHGAQARAAPRPMCVCVHLFVTHIVIVSQFYLPFYFIFTRTDIKWVRFPRVCVSVGLCYTNDNAFAFSPPIARPSAPFLYTLFTSLERCNAHLSSAIRLFIQYSVVFQ